MTLLDQLASGATSAAERTLAKVKSFAVTVQPHTNKAGVKSIGFKIYPVLSDGTAGRFGDHWIRLTDEAGNSTPEFLDAYVDSMPLIYKTALALRERMEQGGEWKPRPKVASVAEVATPTPPAAPKKAAAKAAAPTPKKSVLDDLLGDLPE